MEPSGLNKLENILIENVVINNSLGRTRLALALAGTVQNPLRRVSLSNVTVLEGVVQGAHTEDVAIFNLHVHMSGNNTANAIADLTNAAMIYWHQDHKRTSLSNTHLTRESGSPAGPFVLIAPTGKATGTITPVAGAQFVDGETVTISDGVAAKIFEFDSGSGVAGGRVAVPFTTGSSTAQVRDALVTAVNAQRGFRVTASNTTVDDKSATLLTNDDYGQHGNVAIVETVAAASFAVAGMAGGIGQTESMHFHSGVWTNKVGAGLGLKYFEASGCDHVSVSGVSMRLHAALATEYGFAFRSIGDVDSPRNVSTTLRHQLRGV